MIDKKRTIHDMQKATEELYDESQLERDASLSLAFSPYSPLLSERDSNKANC